MTASSRTPAGSGSRRVVPPASVEHERDSARTARDAAEIARDRAEAGRDEAEHDAVVARLQLDVLHERLEFLEEQVLSTRDYLAATHALDVRDTASPAG
jgi:hypothetical protein